MAALELQSFLWKFTDLCKNGLDANLSVSSTNQRISVSLHVDLDPHKLSYCSSKQRNNFQKPSRVRRRMKRQAARASIQTADPVEKNTNRISMETFADSAVTFVDNDTTQKVINDMEFKNISQPINLDFDTLNPGIYEPIDIDVTFGGTKLATTQQKIDLSDAMCSPCALSPSEFRADEDDDGSLNNDVTTDECPSNPADASDVVSNNGGNSVDRKQDALTFEEFKRIMEEFKSSFTLTLP